MEPSVKFGVIGCGLMGREFASACMRWLHLQGELPRPQIVAACSHTDESLSWFRRVPDTRYFYHDYRQLLENPEVEVVYCAVPHDLHEEVYRAYTGESGSQARENLRSVLDRVGAERVMVRVPLIPGFNTPESRRETLLALKGLGVKKTDCFSYAVHTFF